jgi:LysM repeat protein
MKRVRIICILFFSFISVISLAQRPEDIQKYIDTYKDIAISEMQRTGVPAAIKLAQGIHETEAGTSDLVLKSNNHFGIKCKTGWSGQSVTHTDDAPNECFRKYDSPLDSYRDHSDFLRNSPRYAALFNLDPTDYKGWAYGLKKAGYATNPRYPQIIIKLIEDYNLQDYTLIALGKKVDDKKEILAGTAEDSSDVATNDEGSNTTTIVKKLPDVKRVDYPEGLFMINETKVIYVKQGTSFLNIAQQYEVPLARLFEFNDNMQQQETVPFDQLIYLQRKRKTGANEFHIVQAGETVNDIARAEAIRLSSLLEYNSLNQSQQPAIGEKLYLKSKAPSMPRLAGLGAPEKPESENGSIAGISSNYSESSFIIHAVQGKESLSAIARKYNVSVEDIMNWNSLSGNDLKIGQQLKIYKKESNGANQGTR